MVDKKMPSRSVLDESDYPADLAKTFSDALKALTEARISEKITPAPGERRLFFPDGIQHIKVSVSVGSKDSPIFSAELDVDGGKSGGPTLSTLHAERSSSSDILQVLRAHADPSTVVQTCKDQWPDHMNFCNEFVIAVAQTFGLQLTGLADDILGQLGGGGGWTLLDGGVAASDAAQRGCLVVGGLTAAELDDTSGHVVVVVTPSGPLAFGKYPYAYWGSENARIRPKGGEGTTLNWSFSKAVRDLVRYYSHDI